MYQSEIPQETTRVRTLSKWEGNKIETTGDFEREREKEYLYLGKISV